MQDSDLHLASCPSFRRARPFELSCKLSCKASKIPDKERAYHATTEDDINGFRRHLNPLRIVKNSSADPTSRAPTATPTSNDYARHVSIIRSVFSMSHLLRLSPPGGECPTNAGTCTFQTFPPGPSSRHVFCVLSACLASVSTHSVE